jgi:hypothetical protein
MRLSWIQRFGTCAVSLRDGATVVVVFVRVIEMEKLLLGRLQPSPG